MFASARRFASRIAYSPAWIPLFTLALAVGALVTNKPIGGGPGG